MASALEWATLMAIVGGITLLWWVLSTGLKDMRETLNGVSKEVSDLSKASPVPAYLSTT